MVSEKVFFSVFLPVATLFMFVVGPTFTFLSLQLFFAEDIIPYDLTQHLANGLAAVSDISLDLPGQAVSKNAQDDKKRGRKESETPIKGHVQGIPVLTMNYHFDFLSKKGENSYFEVFDESSHKMIQSIESKPKGERIIGYVHSAPKGIGVGARGVLVSVKEVDHKADGSIGLHVSPGPPFELEAVKNDDNVGFLIGDMEIIPKRKVLFHVGQVVTHKRFNYRGVIVNVDRFCKATDNWIRQMNVDELEHGRAQPFYSVLVDSNDRPGNQETYVAHENIVVTNGEVTHKRVAEYFVKYDSQLGAYLPPN